MLTSVVVRRTAACGPAAEEGAPRGAHIHNEKENGLLSYIDGKRLYTRTRQKYTLRLITIYTEQVITRYVYILII